MNTLEIDEQKRDAVINDILGYEAFRIETPPIVKAVLQNAESKEEILKIALDIRESKAACRFRQFCSSVEQAITEGKRKETEKALSELSAYGLQIAAELGSEKSDNVTQ